MIRTLALALILVATPAAAQQRARVIDGDTLQVGGVTVRMRGLDAPEMHGRCPAETRLALAAARRLAQLVEFGVTLNSRGVDKYRRTLAVVRDMAGRDLALILIAEGLARPYHGERRQGWC